MEKNAVNRIKELLREKNLSQKNLSSLTGITESAISHYVNGTRVPRGTNLIRIANALETTTDDLLNTYKESNKDNDLIFAKSLIARNASRMTKEEKIEFIALLMNEGNKNETE